MYMQQQTVFVYVHYMATLTLRIVHVVKYLITAVKWLVSNGAVYVRLVSLFRVTMSGLLGRQVFGRPGSGKPQLTVSVSNTLHMM